MNTVYTPIGWLERDCVRFSGAMTDKLHMQSMSMHGLPIFSEEQLNKARADILREAASIAVATGVKHPQQSGQEAVSAALIAMADEIEGKAK